ncbi:glycoside hydrolase family 43 [Colletotrichum camelliae]|nr:glycoside hydrolase family 43 [Colletotrichum camelliae]
MTMTTQISAIMKPFLLISTLLSTIGRVQADNPIVQTQYTADPAPLVVGDRVYLFTGHDEDNSTNFDMREWLLFSSIDMVNWQHHGSPMNVATFAWAEANAWAGQAIERNGKFYFYVPTTAVNGNMSIGVGVSDTVTGPYVDAIGAPLLSNGQIDPTVYIDDDGQAYMYWGNPDLLYVKLNEDMISYSGEITKVDLTTEGFGAREGNPSRATTFEEAPWVYKRGDLYYMIFAAVCCPEDIRYSTGPTITGPWTYQGQIMPTEGGSFTNHPGIIDFAGKSYFFYHNGALPGGGGFTRSVAVESFEYNADGTIPQLKMTTEGPAQIVNVDPYVRQEAELIAWSEGVEVEASSEGGMSVAYINDGDYVKVKGVDFGDGAASFTAQVSSATGGGNIELHLDSLTGLLIGTCDVSGSGGWQSWTSVTCSISGAEGVHDLFFKFTGDGTDYLFNFDWWRFGK